MQFYLRGEKEMKKYFFFQNLGRGVSAALFKCFFAHFQKPNQNFPLFFLCRLVPKKKTHMMNGIAEKKGGDGSKTASLQF